MAISSSFRSPLLRDIIETWGFREDINVIVLDKDSDGDVDNNDADNANDVNNANDFNDNNDKDGNDDKGISALGLDRDMGFSRKLPNQTSTYQIFKMAINQ